MRRALLVSFSLLVAVALVAVPAWADPEPAADATVPASGVVSDDPGTDPGPAAPDESDAGSQSAADSDAGSDTESEWVVYELTPVSSVRNLLASAVDTDGSVYNGIGYKAGYRLSSSGVDTEYEGYSVTGFIPCQLGDVVQLQNIALVSGDGNQRISFYDSSFAHLGQLNVTNAAAVLEGVFDADGNLIRFTTQNFVDADMSTVAYFRLSCAGIDGASVILIAEDTTEEDPSDPSDPSISTSVTIWDKPFDEYTPTEGYLFLLFALALGVCLFKLFKGGIW